MNISITTNLTMKISLNMNTYKRLPIKTKMRRAMMNRNDFDEHAAYAAAMREAEWYAQTGEAWFQNLLTVEDVAQRLEVSERTVRKWCQDGTLKNAWKPTPRSAWLIPALALKHFKPPKRGRPKS
jgi:excisionase family DNA binding protein